MKMNPVVHFEMPAQNRQRMSKFYTSVFGWQTNQLGPEMGNYIVVMTAESDKNGPIKPGAINGGFYQKNKDMPNQGPHVVIAVENMKDHVKKVIAAGGKINGKPTDIPGVGKYVSFVDTEDNMVCMLEPLPR